MIRAAKKPNRAAADAALPARMVCIAEYFAARSQHLSLTGDSSPYCAISHGARHRGAL
jgi:hypothetical protein